MQLRSIVFHSDFLNVKLAQVMDKESESIYVGWAVKPNKEA